MYTIKKIEQLYQKYLLTQSDRDYDAVCHTSKFKAELYIPPFIEYLGKHYENNKA